MCGCWNAGCPFRSVRQCQSNFVQSVPRGSGVGESQRQGCWGSNAAPAVHAARQYFRRISACFYHERLFLVKPSFWTPLPLSLADSAKNGRPHPHPEAGGLETAVRRPVRKRAARKRPSAGPPGSARPENARPQAHPEARGSKTAVRRLTRKRGARKRRHACPPGNGRRSYGRFRVKKAARSHGEKKPSSGRNSPGMRSSQKHVADMVWSRSFSCREERVPVKPPPNTSPTDSPTQNDFILT